MQRATLIANSQTYFNPWDTIVDANPQRILERGEPVTLPPMFVLQGELDDNVLPAVQARFEPLGVAVASSTPAQLAARMKAEAALWGPIIKAANIKVYTVRVIDGNASLLQTCATKTDMYFNVQQASQLNSVFSSIAQNLANLRIAK